MNSALQDAVKEIFRFKKLLQDVVFASMNTPDHCIDKVFSIYQEMVELVESVGPFTIQDVGDLLNTTLIKYAKQPFFPVIAGLFINALINKLFQTTDLIEFDIEKLCYSIIDDASKESNADADDGTDQVVNFSLDFIGYLLPSNKTLIVKGPVGDYAGALMDMNSSLIVHGMHGNHFGYERAVPSRLECKDT
jgi:hypothetical protein